VLRQQLGFSYEQLAFHLSDSVTYRTFARLPAHLVAQPVLPVLDYHRSVLGKLPRSVVADGGLSTLYFTSLLAYRSPPWA